MRPNGVHETVSVLVILYSSRIGHFLHESIKTTKMKLMTKARCKDPDAVTMPETITTLTLELTQTLEELLSWCMVFMAWAEL